MAKIMVTESDSISKADMIHKIIDDAMDKKDRYVTVFITGDCMSVNVYPYEAGLQEWIERTEPYGDNFARTRYTCPNCGIDSTYPGIYCTYCGEQLKRKVSE